MFPVSVTLLLFAQVGCEWVEISQQHYKKPLRVTHNYPLLATVGKVNDIERTTKVNRVYINHSLPDYNWNTSPVPKRPNINVNDVQLHSSTVNFKPEHTALDRRPTESDEVIPHEAKGKNNVIIIPKPEINGAVSKNSNRHRIPAAGNVVRVRPIKEKEQNTRRKPSDEYKGEIEVLNMSDLDYVTEKDATTTEFDQGVINTEKYNRKQDISSNPSSVMNKVKAENQVLRKTTTTSFRASYKPNDQVVTKPKGSNMRRVEIMSSTKPTPKEHHSNNDRSYTSTALTEIANEEHKTIYKFPNIDQRKQVQITNNTHNSQRPKSDTRKESSTVPREENSVKNSEEIQNQLRKVDKTRSRVSTTENIFPIKIKPNKNKFENKGPNVIVSPEEIMLEEILTEEEGKQDIRIHKVANLGTVKRISRPKEKEYKNRTETPPEEDINDEVLVEDAESINILNRDYSDDDTSSTERVSVFTTTKFNPKKNVAPKTQEISTQIESYERNPFRPVRPSQETIPEFVTKQEHFNYERSFETTESNKMRTNKVTTETPRKKTKTQMNQFNEPDDKYSNSPKKKTDKENTNEEAPEETISNDTKASTMENLIKFLKTVTNIISRNTRRGVRGKLRYLEDLRDTILANIEERIEAAFPDDDATPRRRGRSTVEPRGHVEFPSSESALMTISFLTFAVFLIKLVLQVIQAYKNKTMMVMPTVVAAVGRALDDQRSRN